jgi:hypothetical protein
MKELISSGEIRAYLGFAEKVQNMPYTKLQGKAVFCTSELQRSCIEILRARSNEVDGVFWANNSKKCKVFSKNL